LRIVMSPVIAVSMLVIEPVKLAAPTEFKSLSNALMCNIVLLQLQRTVVSCCTAFRLSLKMQSLLSLSSLCLELQLCSLPLQAHWV
jgi:hypothetical protein